MSEIYVAKEKESYKLMVAMAGCSKSNLHYYVDDRRILCISNHPTPTNREVLLFVVAVRAGVRVHAHPSLNAPVVGHRTYGERLRAFTPVHHWVSLMGDGWVYVASPPGEQIPLLPVGRPPLSADELGAHRGFARHCVLPNDADRDSAVAHVEGNFFVVTFARAAPLAASLETTSSASSTGPSGASSAAGRPTDGRANAGSSSERY